MMLWQLVALLWRGSPTAIERCFSLLQKLQHAPCSMQPTASGTLHALRTEEHLNSMWQHLQPGKWMSPSAVALHSLCRPWLALKFGFGGKLVPPNPRCLAAKGMSFPPPKANRLVLIAQAHQ